MFGVYPQFWSDDFARNPTKYISCQPTNSSNECTSFVDESGLMVYNFVKSVCFAAFTVFLMIYSLFPIPARKLWISHLNWLLCKKDKRNGDRSKRQIEKSCNTDVAKKSKKKRKRDKRTIDNNIGDVEEVINFDSCRIISNEGASGFSTDSNNSQSLLDSVVVCDTNVDIHIPTEVDKGSSLKRAASLKELRTKLDSIEEMLKKDPTARQEIKRASSFQELIRYSKSD